MNTVGDTLRLLGRPVAALACYRQAVAAFRQTGNRFGESVAITDQGQAHLELGDHERAKPPRGGSQPGSRSPAR